jgi:hypothetical protein
MIDLKELSGYPFFPFAAPYSILMEALGARVCLSREDVADRGWGETDQG